MAPVGLIPLRHQAPPYRRPPMRSMRQAVLRAVRWSATGLWVAC